MTKDEWIAQAKSVFSTLTTDFDMSIAVYDVRDRVSGDDYDEDDPEAWDYWLSQNPTLNAWDHPRVLRVIEAAKKITELVYTNPL